MRTLRTALCLSLLALAACDVGPSADSVALKGGLGELRFTNDASGDQLVQLCRQGSCRKAPDAEYKSARGLTIPVIKGRVKYEERPALFCHYAVKAEKERVVCEDRR